MRLSSSEDMRGGRTATTTSVHQCPRVPAYEEAWGSSKHRVVLVELRKPDFSSLPSFLKKSCPDNNLWLFMPDSFLLSFLFAWFMRLFLKICIWKKFLKLQHRRDLSFSTQCFEIKLNSLFFLSKRRLFSYFWGLRKLFTFKWDFFDLFSNTVYQRAVRTTKYPHFSSSFYETKIVIYEAPCFLPAIQNKVSFTLTLLHLKKCIEHFNEFLHNLCFRRPSLLSLI